MASFWNAPGTVDQDLFKRFRRYLIDKTQINGSLYIDVKNADESGLNWPVALAEEHFSETATEIPVAETPAASVEGDVGSIIDLEEHKRSAEKLIDKPDFETAKKKVAF